MIAIAIFVFVFGLIVGSFLNVCILRIPVAESVVLPSSHCPACGKPIKPYAQFSVGAGTTRAPTNNVHLTRFLPSVAVGADYTLNRHFDWRIVEVSYGSLATVSTSSIGSGPFIPNARLLGFSTGFVFKFP